MAEEKRIKLGSGENGDITNDDLETLDLQKLVDHKYLGPFDFTDERIYLQRLKDLFLELDELAYHSNETNLTSTEINKVREYRRHYLDILNEIQRLPLKMGESRVNQKKEGISNEISQLWKETGSYVRPILNYMKLNVTDVEEYKGLKSELTKELERARNVNNSQVNTQGKEASEEFGESFREQAKNAQDQKDIWFWAGVISFGILIGFIIWIYVFVIGGSEKSGTNALISAIPSIPGLLLLSYAVGFCSKQYNIKSNQQTINEHRRNVANTLTRFYLSSDINQNDKTEIVQQATQAMFENQATGHINKGRHHEDGGPANTIVNNQPFKG